MDVQVEKVQKEEAVDGGLLVGLQAVDGFVRALHAVLLPGDALDQRVGEGAVKLVAKPLNLLLELLVFLGQLIALLMPLIALKQAVAVEKHNPDDERAEDPSNKPTPKGLFGLGTGKLHGGMGSTHERKSVQARESGGGP